jgi:poly-gamma-glutamate synthesis protein (capsule biosynthesis protein)
VLLVDDLSPRALAAAAARIEAWRRDGDLIVVSIHWGGNWGHAIPEAQRRFAHGLIDTAGVDLVHGHSSHHVKGIEVYRDRLILYGCGDFLNDYEGIGGHAAYRGDLSLMYFPALEPGSGRLLGLTMSPTQVRGLQVRRARRADAAWLKRTLDRAGESLGSGAELRLDNTLALRWAA